MAHENTYWEDSNNARNLNEWLESKSGVITYSYVRLKKTIVTVYLDTSDGTTWTSTQVRHMSLFAVLNWQYAVSPTRWNNNFHKFHPDIMDHSTSDNYTDDELSSFDSNCYFHADSIILDKPAILIENGEMTRYFEDYVYPESSSYVSKTHRYDIIDSASNVLHTYLWSYGSDGKLTLDGIHPVVNKNTISPPPTEWMLDDTNHLVMPIYRELIDDLGAFSESSNLKTIIFPDTVISLGKKTCHDTLVSAITLPNECTYYKTTFPESCSITGGRKIVDYGIPKKRYKVILNEVSSNTTLTTNIDCSIGDLVVATFVIRGDTYTLSDEWTLVGLSEVVGTFNQRTGLAYKVATSATESLTITQDSSARIYTNLIAITGASVGTFSGFTTQSTGSSITMNRPNGLVLWAVSATIWSSSTPYPLWNISNTNDTVMIQSSSTQPRCLTVLDQSNDETITFTAGTTNDAALACASLIITGIPDFWYYD